MKVKQLIAILLMLLLLTACSANTDLDRPDEVGPSEQTFNMDASAAEPESSTDRLANQVKKYIEDHFQEELSLDILADKMEISPKYLSRIFKQSIGVNLSEYLMYIRIENAKKMLLADMSMKDVMEKIGMNNRTTFTRAFKRLEGITPNEYRILHKQIV